eukprot:CAMPEP_0204142252 /NCGR_PEP_ID=MMETSP0361-20130328/19892_1 /ASSEMBLY_ACC=CAM_ASM_000343 /TAXON_ID=268821 /ORGANISM="Scrippsiella Hangoei, Strain SHTV-5" /LENGTH=175 /DNA_ID=CAMNT_0051096073 /DNA_START=73 /DNA_END=596 /DNA_ORIENTATION=+
MVKILASGEIVPDNDPRAKVGGGSAASGSSGSVAMQRRTQGFAAQPAQVQQSGGSGGSGATASTDGMPEQENILKGDLARALGIQGKTQVVMGREVPLVYLLAGGVLALLWVAGQMNAIRMLVFGFILYAMFAQYRASQAAGGGGGGGLSSILGGGGGGAPDGGSSGGHVINRGG